LDGHDRLLSFHTVAEKGETSSIQIHGKDHQIIVVDDLNGWEVRFTH
jgi:hypothetical protein